MSRRTPKKERGVFERVPDSGIWWIRYKVAGVEHREKVGRRGDAIKLYAIRKADILRGMKLPANVKYKGIKFKVIAQEAVEWYLNHELKDVRNFKPEWRLLCIHKSPPLAGERCGPPDLLTETASRARYFRRLAKLYVDRFVRSNWRVKLGDGHHCLTNAAKAFVRFLGELANISSYVYDDVAVSNWPCNRSSAF